MLLLFFIQPPTTFDMLDRGISFVRLSVVLRAAVVCVSVGGATSYYTAQRVRTRVAIWSWCKFAMVCERCVEVCVDLSRQKAKMAALENVF